MPLKFTFIIKCSSMVVWPWLLGWCSGLFLGSLCYSTVSSFTNATSYWLQHLHTKIQVGNYQHFSLRSSRSFAFPPQFQNEFVGIHVLSGSVLIDALKLQIKQKVTLVFLVMSYLYINYLISEFCSLSQRPWTYIVRFLSKHFILHMLM